LLQEFAFTESTLQEGKLPEQTGENSV